MEERLSNIIIKVKEELEKYDSLGIIDENKIIENAYRKMKFFGNLVCIKHKLFIDVNDFKAELPRNFYSLTYASLARGEEQQVDVLPDRKITSNVYRVREELPVKRVDNYNYINGDGNYKLITEEVYLRGGPVKSYFVNRDTPLRISKYTSKENCSLEYQNPNFNESKEEISVFGDRLRTNFKNGVVYIEYYGLPEDEDGDLIIMDAGSGELVEFLEVYLTRKYLKTLWIGGGEDLRARIQELRSEERELKSNAMADLKAVGITGKGWYKSVKRNNLRNINRYRIR